MALNQRQVLLTLGNTLTAMAPYAGGRIPASSDPEYSNWVRWLQLGQQDAANRSFWRRLLTLKDDFTITADTDTADLPQDFHKVNGLYALDVAGADWNQPGNTDTQRLFVFYDVTDSTWKVKFLGFTPTQTITTAKLWYFANPPIPDDEEDSWALDGEMIMYYGLKEYFRKARQLGSMDDARLEYENRLDELSKLEVLPSPQELMQMGDYYTHIGQNNNERFFYMGRDRRRGRR